MGRDSSIFHDGQFAGREARNQTGDIPVARRNAQARALGLLKPTEILTSETLLALQEMFRVVRPGGKVVVMDAVPAAANLMDFHPEQVNGYWYIQYPLAVFGWEVNESNQ